MIEDEYAKKILLKVLQGSSFGQNKKLMRVMLFTYINSIREELADVDYNKVCDLCISHLEKHNYL